MAKKLEADEKGEGETGGGKIVEATGADFKKVVVMGAKRSRKE